MTRIRMFVFFVTTVQFSKIISLVCFASDCARFLHPLGHVPDVHSLTSVVACLVRNKTSYAIRFFSLVSSLFALSVGAVMACPLRSGLIMLPNPRISVNNHFYELSIKLSIIFIGEAISIIVQ